MIFKFLRRPIVLDCFTPSTSVIETAPITHATRHYPEWWKQLPKSFIFEGNFFPTATMKSCAGFVDFYKNSVVIPAWSSIAIEVYNRIYKWQFSDMVSNAEIHSQRQRGGFLPDIEYGHIKIVSPWFLRTKQDIKWVFIGNTYNQTTPEDFITMPGVLNFSLQGATNINLMVPLKTNRVINIPVNNPLVHLIPLTERTIKVKRHLVSEAEYQRLRGVETPIAFTHKYRMNNKLRAMYKDCPFKDHTK